MASLTSHGITSAVRMGMVSFDTVEYIDYQKRLDRLVLVLVCLALPETAPTPTAKSMPTAAVGLLCAMPTATSWPSAYLGRRATTS